MRGAPDPVILISVKVHLKKERTFPLYVLVDMAVPRSALGQEDCRSERIVTRKPGNGGNILRNRRRRPGLVCGSFSDPTRTREKTNGRSFGVRVRSAHASQVAVAFVVA